MPTGNNFTYHYQTSDNTAGPIGVGEPVYIGDPLPSSNGWTSGTTWVYSNPFNQSSQPKESEKKKMRGLYQVYIVDPESDEVILDSGAFVAKNEDNAQLKAVQMAGGTLTKDLDDYDFIVVELGEVRAKKEVQEVRIAEKK